MCNRKLVVVGLTVRWHEDRINRKSLHSWPAKIWVKANTSTGHEGGVASRELFPQGDTDWHYYLCAEILLSLSQVGSVEKFLQQCYVRTKPRACSVAQEVGGRLCAFLPLLLFKKSLSNEHWCAIGSAEHAGGNDSLLSDMVTDGTCWCCMLTLEAYFTGPSQDTENNYVVTCTNVTTVPS